MNEPHITITQEGGSSSVEVYACYSGWRPMAGTGEYRYPHHWFYGPFLDRWKYTTLIHYHPILREVIRTYAVPLRASERLQQQILRSNYAIGVDFYGQYHQRWFRGLLLRWKYRLLVRFHPVLGEVVRAYAARIVPARHSQRRL